jgi:hypothetical protein
LEKTLKRCKEIIKINAIAFLKNYSSKNKTKYNSKITLRAIDYNVNS